MGKGTKKWNNHKSSKKNGNNYGQSAANRKRQIFEKAKNVVEDQSKKQYSDPALKKPTQAQTQSSEEKNTTPVTEKKQTTEVRLDNKHPRDNVNIETEANQVIEKANELASKIKLDAEAETVRIKQEATQQAQLILDAADAKIKEGVEKNLEDYKAKMEAERQALIFEKRESEKLLRSAEDMRIAAADYEIMTIQQRTALETEKQTYQSQIKKEIADDLMQLQERGLRLDEEKRKLEVANKNLQIEIKCYEANLKDLREVLEKTKDRAQQFEHNKANLELANAAIDQLNGLKTELLQKIAVKDAALLRFGDDPEALIQKNQTLESDNKLLNDRLSQYPSHEELLQVRADAEAYKQMQISYKEQLETNKDQERQIIEFKLKEEDVNNYRRFIQVQQTQKEQLQRELDALNRQYSENEGAVFPSLSNVDTLPKLPVPGSSNVRSIQDLCDNFRSYVANREDPEKKKLFYSKRDIRTFVAGFATSRLTILEGLSGTGKSSLPRAFAEYIGCQCFMVPVQSSWKDRNDLLGFYNDFKKQYKETNFLEDVYRASANHGTIYIIVLDEMNLSRIEYYFNDFLSVLEIDNKEEWKIHILNDDVGARKKPQLLDNDGNLPVLDNLWFVGTANRDDSTSMITDKVYDRATVINFTKKGEFEKGSYNEKAFAITLGTREFNDLLKDAAKYINGDDKILKIFKETKDFLDAFIRNDTTGFNINFGNRISNQMDVFVPVYMACAGSKNEEMLYEAIDVIFSRKVVRKLEGLYDKKTGDNIGLFLSELSSKYPTKSFELTKKALQIIKDRI